jgi:hypothetical protein
LLRLALTWVGIYMGRVMPTPDGAALAVYIGGDSWVVQNATPVAVGWPVLLTAIFVPLGVRRYRRLSR